jgi:hypothetical protein
LYCKNGSSIRELKKSREKYMLVFCWTANCKCYWYKTWQNVNEGGKNLKLLGGRYE